MTNCPTCNHPLPAVRLCRYCHKVLRGVGVYYCSTACRNRYHVGESRKRGAK